MKPRHGQNRDGIHYRRSQAKAGPHRNYKIHRRIRLVKGSFRQVDSGHYGGENRRSQQHSHRYPAQDFHFHSPIKYAGRCLVSIGLLEHASYMAPRSRHTADGVLSRPQATDSSRNVNLTAP